MSTLDETLVEEFEEKRLIRSPKSGMWRRISGIGKSPRASSLEKNRFGAVSPRNKETRASIKNKLNNASVN